MQFIHLKLPFGEKHVEHCWGKMASTSWWCNNPNCFQCEQQELQWKLKIIYSTFYEHLILNKSVMRSVFILTVCVCVFLAKGNGQKKLLVKCSWKWHLEFSISSTSVEMEVSLHAFQLICSVRCSIFLPNWIRNNFKTFPWFYCTSQLWVVLLIIPSILFTVMKIILLYYSAYQGFGQS